MIPVLILAAGTSSRMRGTDKLMEDVDGIPLLRRSVQRALTTSCAVFVALPAVPHARYEVLSGLTVTSIPVGNAAEGINASLRTGLAALPQNTDAAMVLLADMPDLTTDDLNTVMQAVDLKSETLIWRATTQTGAAGHPIVFSKTLFAEIITLSGDKGGSEVVKKHHNQTLYIPLPGNRARTDLDTPEAWASWRLQRPT